MVAFYSFLEGREQGLMEKKAAVGRGAAFFS
jgi:hypothetical protein